MMMDFCIEVGWKGWLQPSVIRESLRGRDSFCQSSWLLKHRFMSKPLEIQPRVSSPRIRHRALHRPCKGCLAGLGDRRGRQYDFYPHAALICLPMMESATSYHQYTTGSIDEDKTSGYLSGFIYYFLNKRRGHEPL